MKHQEMLKHRLLDRRFALASWLFNVEDSLSKEEQVEIDAKIATSLRFANNEQMEDAIKEVNSTIKYIESLFSDERIGNGV
jgi:hypothetical protein